jgi:hypothetical protein
MRLIELQLSTSADLQACVVESLRNTERSWGLFVA